MNTQMQLGQKVIHNGYHKHHKGRVGIVEHITPTEVRVRWTHESDGKPVLTKGKNTGKGIRTWIAKDKVKIYAQPLASNL